MGTPKKDAINHVQSKTNGETYGKVILTLKNCLLPDEKLSPTPSQIDGLDPDTEMDLRILGCELMQTAGILLKLPQVAMATAQVLFHRFYYSKSFVRQNYEITGMGCLYLASKIEEAPRRIRDVINVYHHIKQVNSQKSPITYLLQFLRKIGNSPISPMILDQSYINLKYQVIKAERRVLKELGFCVHVKHPHKLIVMYLQVLGLETKQALMQLAWNYMNDSLRTDVFVRYQPETIACACIYLTARKLKIVMPKLWFAVFEVEEKHILDICVRILRLYVRPKPNVEMLEKKVQELTKKFEENRQKNKTGFSSNVASGTNTPTSPSVTEKKTSPKRRSHSDRSKSRSRSTSASPKHKKSKKHKRSTSRSRSRSRSYEKKYKKSHKNSRRSRSSSPSSKSYKDRKYRSRSKSYEREREREREREYRKLPNDGKYYSDRYKEEKGYDRYYAKEDKYSRNKDKDDDKYRKEKSSSKEDERNKKEDKHKKNDDNFRKDDKYREDNYKNNTDKNFDDDFKDDRKLKYKNDDKYSRDNKYPADKNAKNDKYEEKDRYSGDKYSSKEKYRSIKSDKINSKEDDYISKDENYSSKRDKYENDRKRKSKHKTDDEEDDDEDEDDVEVISVKREKKSR